MWDKLKAQYDAEIAAKVPEPITVTLPDGKQVPAQSWRTTPYDVAKSIRSVNQKECLNAIKTAFPL
jgi:threonyl-tRNA synthetase